MENNYIIEVGDLVEFTKEAREYISDTSDDKRHIVIKSRPAGNSSGYLITVTELNHEYDPYWLKVIQKGYSKAAKVLYET